MVIGRVAESRHAGAEFPRTTAAKIRNRTKILKRLFVVFGISPSHFTFQPSLRAGNKHSVCIACVLQHGALLQPDTQPI